MTIEEFAQRLDRDEHPTRLMEALRTLQSGDLGSLKESNSLGLGWPEWPSDDSGGSMQVGWYPWPDFEPGDSAELPELRN